MEENQLGCRFSLSPMSDQYIDIILGAVAKTNTSRISSATGKLSTIYQGAQEDVMDALKACLCYAYNPSVHMTMEMTFFKASATITQQPSAVLANAPQIADVHFPISSKIALYPLGTVDYQPHLDYLGQAAQKAGIFVSSLEDVTVIEGDVQQLFDYFATINAYCLSHLKQFGFEVTLSMNSPTPD